MVSQATDTCSTSACQGLHVVSQIPHLLRQLAFAMLDTFIEKKKKKKHFLSLVVTLGFALQPCSGFYVIHK